MQTKSQSTLTLAKTNLNVSLLEESNIEKNEEALISSHEMDPLDNSNSKASSPPRSSKQQKNLKAASTESFLPVPEKVSISARVRNPLDDGNSIASSIRSVDDTPDPQNYQDYISPFSKNSVAFKTSEKERKGTKNALKLVVSQ